MRLFDLTSYPLTQVRHAQLRAPPLAFLRDMAVVAVADCILQLWVLVQTETAPILFNLHDLFPILSQPHPIMLPRVLEP